MVTQQFEDMKQMVSELEIHVDFKQKKQHSFI